jgi:hypothetical protein
MKVKKLNEWLNESSKKPKFKIGDKVYSYQNKKELGEVNRIVVENDPEYEHKYRITLPNGQNSKWIDEPSLSKEPLNEEEVIDNNSEKNLKPLLPKFKDVVKGDWEFKGYSINYHNESNDKWAQVMLIDDPPTKVNIKIGNLKTDPNSKRLKDENFKLENFDEILEYLKNNL